MQPFPPCLRLIRSSCVLGGIVFCGALAASSPARCQDAYKTPPQPAVPNVVPRPLESGRLASVSELFKNDDAGWFARVGGLGDGNGLALGGGYRLATQEGVLTTRALASPRRAYLLSADWRRALDRQGRWSIDIGLSERLDAQQRFAGTGPHPDETLTGYSLRTRTVDVAAGWQARPWLTTTFGVAAVKPTLGRSTLDAIVPLTDRYNSLDAVGLTVQPTFAMVHAGVAIDTRQEAHDVAGGRYAVEWKHFDDRSNAGQSFQMLSVDLAHATELGSPGRILSFHMLGQQTTADGGSRVPFYFQPTLGGNRSLRGYERQQFRGQSAFLVQAEYLHRVHRYASAAVFVDAGQVARRLSDVPFGSLLTDYGVGVVLGKVGGAGLRTDLAFGGDGRPRVVVGFSTGF